MKSRKYVPGILVDGRGLRGPKGDKGDPGFVISEITSYLTNLTDYARGTHTHGDVLGYNISATSASDGLTLSVGNYLTTAALSNHSHTDLITGAALSTHTHGSVYVTSKTGTNVSFSSASSGLTVSVPPYLTTAANSYHSHSDLYIPLANSASYQLTANNSLSAYSTHTHGPVTALGNIIIGSSSNGAVFSVSEGIKQIQLAGNTVGTGATISTGTVVLAAAGNITLSQNGNTVTIFGSGASGGGVGTGYTSSSTASGTNIAVTLNTAGLSLVYPSFLTTSNGIGLNTAITGGSMTGNSSGLSINLPAYLTTAMVSNAGSNFIGLNTAVTNGSLTADSRGISLNIPNYLTTAAASDHTHTDFIGLNSAITGGSMTVNTSGISINVDQAAGIGLNTAITGGSMTANTSGISINVDAAAGPGLNSAITGGSMTVNTSGISIDLPAYITTAMASDAGSSFVGLGSAITGGSMTLNSGGVSLNIPSGGVAIAGSATSTVTGGTVQFVNSNGISFGLSSDSMTASWLSNNYVLTALSSVLQHTSANSLFSQTYQLTANNSLSLGNTYTSHTHGTIYTSSITGSVVTNSSASSGLTLGIPAYITSAGAHTHTNYAEVTHIHGSIAVTGGLGATSASSGLSLSLPNYLITVPNANLYFSNESTNNLTFGSNASGSSTTITAKAERSGVVYYSNVNGISFGTSTSGISTSVSASYTVPTVGYVHFSNSNNVTFGSSVSGYSTTITASINTSGITAAADGVNIIAAGGSTANSTGTIIFSNSNGVSFGLYSGSRVSVSHDLQYSSNTSAITSAAFHTSRSSLLQHTSATSAITSAALPLASSTRYYSTTSQFSASFLNTGYTTHGHSAYLTTAMNSTEPHIRALGFSNTGTYSSNVFTSGSVMLSGVNLTVSSSANGASQYLNISAPAIGYLFFSNTNGHSWSSSVNGMSTSVYIIT